MSPSTEIDKDIMDPLRDLETELELTVLTAKKTAGKVNHVLTFHLLKPVDVLRTLEDQQCRGLRSSNAVSRNRTVVYLTEIKNFREQSNRDAAYSLVTSATRRENRYAFIKAIDCPLPTVSSEGNIGLMQAVKRFDPERCAPCSRILWVNSGEHP